jgi:hypothetical protein
MGIAPLRHSLPLPSIAHGLWPRQIHGPGQGTRSRNQFGPLNLGGLRLDVKRPMATATGMAPGDIGPNSLEDVVCKTGSSTRRFWELRPPGR